MGTIDLKSLVTVRPDVIAPARRGKLEYVNNGYEPPVGISCEGATESFSWLNMSNNWNIEVDGVLYDTGSSYIYFFISADDYLSTILLSDGDGFGVIKNIDNVPHRIKLIKQDSNNSDIFISADMSSNPTITIDEKGNVGFCLVCKSNSGQEDIKVNLDIKNVITSQSRYKITGTINNPIANITISRITSYGVNLGISTCTNSGNGSWFYADSDPYYSGQGKILYDIIVDDEIRTSGTLLFADWQFSSKWIDGNIPWSFMGYKYIINNTTYETIFRKNNSNDVYENMLHQLNGDPEIIIDIYQQGEFFLFKAINRKSYSIDVEVVVFSYKYDYSDELNIEGVDTSFIYLISPFERKNLSTVFPEVNRFKYLVQPSID